MGLALFLGLAVTLLMTPKYAAVATAQIDNENVKIVSGQDIDPTVSINDTIRYINTQMGIVQSRTVALLVIDDLGLDKNDTFLTTMRARLPDARLPAAQRKQALREAAVEVLAANLKVEVPVDDRVMSIQFTSPNAVMAMQVANSFARNFVANNVRRGLDANSYARKVLEQQIEVDRVQLDQAERKAIAYAQENHLIDASDASGSGSGASDPKSNSPGSGNSQSITTANLVRLNGQYIDAVNQRIMAEQRWHAAQTTPPEQLTEVVSNIQLQSLISQRATTAGQVANMKAKYQANFPQLIQAQAELNFLNSQIDRQINGIKESIRYQYKVAQAQEASLSSERERLSNQTLDEQRRRVQLNLLARDVESRRHQVADLMDRYNQIASASDIVRNNISLIDAAIVPSQPVSPNLLKNMGIAFALGIVIATLLMIAREAVDDTLRGPDDVESKLGLSLLGTTPKMTSEQLDSSLGDQKNPLTEAYYSVRVALDYSTLHGVPDTLLVTSSQPSEGKSTTALALARDYARIGKQVLLIDGDLRRPSLHRALGLANSVGFVDVLLQHKPLAECIQTREDYVGLSLLTLGKTPPNPVEILSSNVISEFLNTYKPQFDIIIVDSAPVMGLADTPLLARQVDTVLMIVEANRAHRGQAKTAVRRLLDAGASIAGVVLTKFDHRNAGYNYDYHYRYYSYDTK
jgi:capsular exopolysaccharide synthesis family protein